MSTDYPEIYLQAEADADYAGDGRLWCQDDVWTGEPENSPPTKYIRADLHDAAQARVSALEAVLRKADAAIAEYVRYLDGGELRGSYDGKQETRGLRNAGYATRSALNTPPVAGSGAECEDCAGLGAVPTADFGEGVCPKCGGTGSPS